MGFWDELGKVVAASAAQTLAERGITSDKIRNMSSKQLVEESYELQSDLMFCDPEEKHSNEYQSKSDRKALIDSILRGRGYLTMTIYLKKDFFDEIDELADLLQGGFEGLYDE